MYLGSEVSSIQMYVECPLPNGGHSNRTLVRFEIDVDKIVRITEFGTICRKSYGFHVGPPRARGRPTRGASGTSEVF